MLLPKVPYERTHCDPFGSPFSIKVVAGKTYQMVKPIAIITRTITIIFFILYIEVIGNLAFNSLP